MKKIALFTILVIIGARCEQGRDRSQSQRERMVQTQIADRGVRDTSTLRAMRTVPRYEFVPPEWRANAYDDSPLPIGHDQTISQPYIVAFMTEAIKPHKGQRVLEIGTGSGYQAAVLAEIVDSVYTIELLPELAVSSAQLLKRLGYRNVVVRQGDGYLGWPEHAPYDAILVTAAADVIPGPLIEQLKDGGTMVIPLGVSGSVQSLTLVKKLGKEVTTEIVMPVRFVPLVHPQ